MESVMSFYESGYRTSDEQKYDYLEPILHEINRDYVTLHEEETRRNTMVLNEVLNEIVNQMAEDKLFKSLFRDVCFGGSYYDGLKMKMNEYNLDLLLDLPKYTHPVISDRNMPGYVTIDLKNTRLFETKEDEFIRYPYLALELLDEDYHLSTFKVFSWMESVLQKALNRFPVLSTRYKNIKSIGTQHGTFYFCSEKGDCSFRHGKQGSVFTLKIRGKFEGQIIEMDIDLVPCFVFAIDELPECYKRNEHYSRRPEFFVVPKTVPNQQSYNTKYWGLSFQAEEDDLIKGKPRLEHALQLLKQLRDCSGHCVTASYYIKTIFLWETQNKNDDFWSRQSLSYVFMTMLKIYQQHIQNYKVPYFWNKYNNLLDQYYDITLINISNDLTRIIMVMKSHNPQRIMSRFQKLPVTCKGAIPCTPEGSSFWNSVEDLPENKHCTIL